MIEEDPTIFFDDFALPVMAQGVFVEKGGILDEPQEYITEDGDVMVSDYTLLVLAAQFGQLRLGDVVMVDGIRYRVRRDARKRVDGLHAEVPLMRMGTTTTPAP